MDKCQKGIVTYRPCSRHKDSWPPGRRRACLPRAGEDQDKSAEYMILLMHRVLMNKVLMHRVLMHRVLMKMIKRGDDEALSLHFFFWWKAFGEFFWF